MKRVFRFIPSMDEAKGITYIGCTKNKGNFYFSQKIFVYLSISILTPLKISKSIDTTTLAMKYTYAYDACKRCH